MVGAVFSPTVPVPVLAHGVGGRLDLPVPLSYFVAASVTVLILTFVALTVAWPRPRLQSGPRSRTMRLSVLATATVVARMVGVLGLMVVIVSGAVQVWAPTDRATIAPVLVWVGFWLVIPFLSIVAGDLYTAFNPWRTVSVWLRLGSIERPEVGERVGVWPATGLLVAFAWFELVWPESASPVSLATAAVVYSIVLLGCVVRFGLETALGSFDIFTVYNRLFSAISPIGRHGDHLLRRGWLRALPVLSEWNGLWAFVITMIATVTFDGLSSTDWWPADSALANTGLMVAVIAVLAGTYLIACRSGVPASRRSSRTVGVAQRFAHTLVPIGVAYAVAHYFTLVVFEGQQLISGVSDPFGLGWDLFGTAARKVDFFIRRPEPVWYLQVALIVAGHITGVVLSHDRALVDFEGDAAIRSEYALLGLMVLLTGLGLVILAG